MFEFEILDVEWGKELEHGVDEYLIECLDSVDTEEDEFVTLSGEPFCGCSTCYWREVLFYVTPKILEGADQGKVRLTNG